MTTLTFNQTTLNPVNQSDNQIWITSKDLANALGYKQADSVTKIFNRNSDEFSKNMARAVNISRGGQIDRQGNLATKTRIFSLRGCHLIAMFSRTAIAKEFRVWVLDILEKSQKTTAKQREVFISACDKLAVNNTLRSDVYKSVANHFGYDKPVNMPVDVLPEAIAYVYEELLAQEKIRKSKSTKRHLIAETAINISERANKEAWRHITAVENELEMALLSLKKIANSNVTIGNSFADIQMGVDCSFEERQQARISANR